MARRSAVRIRSEPVTVPTPRGPVEIVRQEMRGLRRGSGWTWHFPATGTQFFARYGHPRRGLVADSGCLPQVFEFGPGRVVFAATDARSSRR